MKVAVCVGGLVYPDSEGLMDQLQIRFPDYDFFFGVWSGRENDLTNKLNAWSFVEHEPTYHPYLDVNLPKMARKVLAIRGDMKTKPKRLRSLIDKAPHQTKQILMHSYMLDLIPPEYDMIMRTRYDVKFADNDIDWTELIEKSYNENRAVGVARKFPHMPQLFDPKGDSHWGWRLWEGYVMDMVTFHPRGLFDRELVMSLHEQQNLLAAEFGWYQILSEPYGDTHQNHMCDISITSRGDK